MFTKIFSTLIKRYSSKKYSSLPYQCNYHQYSGGFRALSNVFTKINLSCMFEGILNTPLHCDELRTCNRQLNNSAYHWCKFFNVISVENYLGIISEIFFYEKLDCLQRSSIQDVREIFRKSNISHLLISARTCANVNFSESFAYVHKLCIAKLCST